jgi:hypothetical protein
MKRGTQVKQQQQKLQDSIDAIVEQFRYPADPSDRYYILQTLPQDVIMNLLENGFDLPMPLKERKAVINHEYADVIEKLMVYGCDNPMQLLLTFNSIEKGCETLRRATSKQVRSFIDMFDLMAE